MDEVMMEMPRYKCHKEVWALKINKIVDGLLYPVDKNYGAISPGRDWWNRCKPEVGGYYVVYEDGYRSYSPAKAFEEGYTRI